MAKRPQRQCAFCGSNGPFTKEHVWSKWLGKHTAVTDHTRITSAASVVHDTAGVANIHPLETLQRPGSALNFVVREVCRDCNNGWMSRMEIQAERILEPMLRGDPATVSPADAQLLATWATKSAYMNEYLALPAGHRQDGPTATSQSMRGALMDSMRPPAASRVWAAHHVGSLNIEMRTAELVVARDPDPRSQDTFSVLITAISVEKVTLLVWSTDCDLTEPPRLRADQWIPLWPNPETVAWPPPESVSDAEVVRASTDVSDRYRTVDTRGVRFHQPAPAAQSSRDSYVIGS